MRCTPFDVGPYGPPDRGTASVPASSFRFRLAGGEADLREPGALSRLVKILRAVGEAAAGQERVCLLVAGFDRDDEQASGPESGRGAAKQRREVTQIDQHVRRGEHVIVRLS